MNKLSRTGHTSPLGKCTAEIPKLKVPEETHRALEEASRAAGLSLSEFVREVLMIRAHGKQAVLSLYARRLEVVDRMGRK